MPGLEIDPAGGAPTDPFSSDDDVRLLLGPIGNKLPAWVIVADFRGMAHAEVVDKLGEVYPSGIPAFDGNAATVVRWAEAKIAAAEILDSIRVNLTEDQAAAADGLREAADRVLANGVVGYPVGATPDDGSTPGRVTVPGPRVSSFTPLSAFPDPYAEARDETVPYQ